MGVSLEQLAQAVELTKEYVDEQHTSTLDFATARTNIELIYESNDFAYTTGCDLTPFVKIHSFADGERPLEHSIGEYQMLVIELSVSHTVTIEDVPRVMTHTENEFLLNPVVTVSKEEDKASSIHLFNMTTDVITYDNANTETKYYPIGKVDIVATMGDDTLEVVTYKVSAYEGSGNLNHTAKIRVYGVNHMSELGPQDERASRMRSNNEE